jgi:hypothetical protein
VVCIGVSFAAKGRLTPAIRPHRYMSRNRTDAVFGFLDKTVNLTNGCTGTGAL